MTVLSIDPHDPRWTSTKRSPYVRYLDVSKDIGSSEPYYITTEPMKFDEFYSLQDLWNDVVKVAWFTPPQLAAVQHTNDPYGNYDLVIEVWGVREATAEEVKIITEALKREADDKIKAKRDREAKDRKEFERLRKVFPNG